MDWDLHVSSKWLIMGDSNIASLPEHDIQDLQIDCFPDSHFRHAQALLEKTTPTPGLSVSPAGPTGPRRPLLKMSRLR